jgi:hypothetical protein
VKAIAIVMRRLCLSECSVDFAVTVMNTRRVKILCVRACVRTCHVTLTDTHSLLVTSVVTYSSNRRFAAPPPPFYQMSTSIPLHSCIVFERSRFKISVRLSAKLNEVFRGLLRPCRKILEWYLKSATKSLLYVVFY